MLKTPLPVDLTQASSLIDFKSEESRQVFSNSLILSIFLDSLQEKIFLFFTDLSCSSC